MDNIIALDLLKRLVALWNKGEICSRAELISDGENGDGEIQWDESGVIDDELLDILTKAKQLTT